MIMSSGTKTDLQKAKEKDVIIGRKERFITYIRYHATKNL